jgi:hypothetical protein
MQHLIIIAAMSVSLCPELPEAIPVTLKPDLHRVEGTTALGPLKLLQRLTLFGSVLSRLNKRRKATDFDRTEFIFITALLPNAQPI